ncbi:M16 family metallopeptidase [Paracoccaceae bacterium GXU_MW_L88]
MKRFLVALSLIAAPLHALEVEAVTSPDGYAFWLVEEPQIPMIAMDFVFPGGAALEPADKAGATGFMMGMLEEGSGARSDVEFATAREELAASFGFSARRDEVSVSATMLSENAAEAAALLSDALSAPRFDETPLERVRGQLMAGRAQDLQDPNAIAQEALSAAVFPDHAYGRPVNGTEETIPNLTAEDLEAARVAALGVDDVIISVVGDVSAEEAGALIDEILADLPEEGATPEAVPEMQASGLTEVIDLDTPQSVAIFGEEGLAQDDPDFLAAYVVNHILGGGGFASRLTDELREKRGLTYGADTGLSLLDGAPMMVGQFAASNERMAEAIEILRSEWARMAEEGPTEEELAKAKTYLTGSFPLRFDSNSKIAGVLAGFQRSGYDLDYIDRRNGLIEALTIEDVRRAASRLLDEERLRVVIVGQPGLD